MVVNFTLRIGLADRGIHPALASQLAVRRTACLPCTSVQPAGVMGCLASNAAKLPGHIAVWSPAKLCLPPCLPACPHAPPCLAGFSAQARPSEACTLRATCWAPLRATRRSWPRAGRTRGEHYLSLGRRRRCTTKRERHSLYGATPPAENPCRGCSYASQLEHGGTPGVNCL